MMNLSSNVILNNTSEEIINSYQEQISTLCSTIAGTIPLDRDFGIDSACLSKPPDVATALLSVEIMEKVEKYIPQLIVNSVEFSSVDDGTLTPIIKVGYNEDYAAEEDTEDEDDLSTDEDDYYYADEDDYDADEFDEEDIEEDEE